MATKKARTETKSKNVKLGTHKLCSQPRMIPRKLESGIDSNRVNFILSNGLRWANGTEIKYMFIEGAEDQRDVVRYAFQKWKNLGIGLSFSEVTNTGESMVRIGFDLNDGSWSYVGRDVLTISKAERTMNFGWDLTADSYGMTTALHEIGHTIGFQHEHQSPYSGIEWNVDAVYREFSLPPNSWSPEMIDNNIINKLPPNELTGSQWDADSIMEYQFGPGLVNKPEPFQNGIFPPGILSAKDIKGVKHIYPLFKTSALIKLELFNMAPVNVPNGQQADFIFTAPTTAKYTFQTVGEMDTVMVVSEMDKKENHYLAGDDDSGFSKNSKVTLPLVKKRKYLINVRVMYSAGNIGGVVVTS